MVAPRQSISSCCYLGMFLAPCLIQGSAPPTLPGLQGPRGQHGFVTPGWHFRELCQDNVAHFVLLDNSGRWAGVSARSTGLYRTTGLATVSQLATQSFSWHTVVGEVSLEHVSVFEIRSQKIRSNHKLKNKNTQKWNHSCHSAGVPVQQWNLVKNTKKQLTEKHLTCMCDRCFRGQHGSYCWHIHSQCFSPRSLRQVCRWAVVS